MEECLLEKSHHCPHYREERLLRGTWYTPELVKAVEVGYHIAHVQVVWHFPEEQCQEGLFAGYIYTWLKKKISAQGLVLSLRKGDWKSPL